MCALSALNSGVTCRVCGLELTLRTGSTFRRGEKRRPPASHITRQLPVNETQICLMSSTMEAHAHVFFFFVRPSIYNSLHLNMSHGFFLPRVHFFSCCNDDRNTFVIIYKYSVTLKKRIPECICCAFRETVNS